ncbi:MAG: 5-dehydro-4-deoxy-D-glucuronate isomerase [Kiritimatiellae bacterium]|nr:5-dehydro-4-deoxy-D-glucuronate isomerase [Kiritimatiellia bacterium]
MDVRYTVGRNEMKRMTTEELRAAFVNTKLWEKGRVNLMYCEVERGIAGFAVPAAKPLALPAGRELASAFFCERRELGALNIGGEGSVTVDGKKHALRPLDVLYVGKGAKKVVFASKSAKKPAEFYLVSYPAHKAYPTKPVTFENATHRRLGTKAECNERTIHQYILPGKCESCQLVMGVTRLEPGSNWNTMPAHTHERRTEMYMYFGIEPEATVFHFMGPCDETRHLTVHNRDVVVSPMWSIHSGVGTRAYTFCWAMGGENQAFDDMDGIATDDLR